MNEKFNKNVKVEQVTKMLGKGVRLIVILPLKIIINHDKGHNIYTFLI